jgi:protein tyrosine/serine phosphatase
MSVNVTDSGEIIESRNYLSNYFVTLNTDQRIYGNKTIDNLNVSSLNVSQINSTTLDISTNNLTLNGGTIKTLETIFGSADISANLSNGTIYFGKIFDL